MRRLLGTGLCLATLFVLISCGGDDDPSDASGATSEVDGTGGSTLDSGSTDDTTDGTDGTDGSSTTATGSTGTTVAGSTGTTVAGTGTTVAGSSGTTAAGTPTTVAAPATTNAVPATPADLVLLPDGIGPLRFGIDSQAMVDSITAVLGAPTSDAAGDYPIPAEDGSFQTSDGELAFVQPFGRTVCWANGLCTESAGATAGPYGFVGWYYAATDTDPLVTADGLGVGSTWADFQSVMTVDPGGCYSVGYGMSNGVSLNLQSSGDPFSQIDDAGNVTPMLPDPADVIVVQMQAGAQVTFLFADC